MSNHGPILALDSASPTVSLAIAHGKEILGQRSLPLRQSSERLLLSLDELMREIGLQQKDLGALVALQGPGSFTGLRVGLATLLGMHQALGIKASTLPTLAVLAAAAGDPGETLTVAVDALRGQWFTATYRADPWPELLRQEGLVDAAELCACGHRVAGFGVHAAAKAGPASEFNAAESAVSSALFLEAPPLAATAALLASRPEMVWDKASLLQPIYFRPPAVSLPGKKPGA